MERLLACVVAALLAGCATPASSDTAPAPAGETATRSDGDGTASPPATSSSDLAGAEVAQTPFSENGLIKAGACVEANCKRAPGGKQSFEIPLARGTLDKLHLEVTWTPASPTTDELTVSISALREGEEVYEGLHGARGTSPLVVDLQEMDFGPADKIYFIVGSGSATTAADQTFHFEGVASLITAAKTG